MSSAVASYISLLDCTNRLYDVFESGSIITIADAKTVPKVPIVPIGDVDSGTNSLF